MAVQAIFQAMRTVRISFYCEARNSPAALCAQRRGAFVFSAQINAGHAGTDAAQKLVGDGARRLGRFLGGDALRAVRADERCHIPHRRACVCCIHQKLVHTHPAHNGRAPAVQQHMAQKKAAFHGCPGSATKLFQRQAAPAGDGTIPSQLAQWPCQIRLISPGAPCFAGAHLLIAADCTAYAYADFHRDFMQGRVTLIGCPKLDAYDYAEKLTAILAANSIQSVTLLRMEVPCCGGLEHAAHTALAASGKSIPLRVVTIRTNGTPAVTPQ